MDCKQYFVLNSLFFQSLCKQFTAFIRSKSYYIYLQFEALAYGSGKTISNQNILKQNNRTGKKNLYFYLNWTYVNYIKRV